MLPLIPVIIRGGLFRAATHGAVRGSSLLRPVSLVRSYIGQIDFLLCIRSPVELPEVASGLQPMSFATSTGILVSPKYKLDYRPPILEKNKIVSPVLEFVTLSF